MPRLFIAIPIDPPRELRGPLDGLAALRDTPILWPPGTTPLRLKPVDPRQLHLTLRFLGETDAARVPDVVAALERAVDAARVHAFDFQFTRLATLPPRGAPRVLIAEPRDPTPLLAIERALSGELLQLDPPFPPESRPYRPHLTLARLVPPHRRRRPAAAPPPVDLRAQLASLADTSLGCSRVGAVHLIESRLLPTGPIYTTRHAARLRSA